MCFSAEASFTGSAVITLIGAVALTKVKKPAQVPFAAVPLIFGIQQCAEGVLWITLKSNTNADLQNIAVYVFLITALVIWPTMIPLSIWLLENGKQRKKALAGLLATGGIISLFYTVCLLIYPVYPQIQFLHIQYVDKFPGNLVEIAFVLYLIVTILPLFVSSIKRMWVFGILVAVSCLISWIFFAQFLTSVWCFFAAIISILIYWILGRIPETSIANDQKHSLVNDWKRT
jgi:hypothetical protein